MTVGIFHKDVSASTDPDPTTFILDFPLPRWYNQRMTRRNIFEELKVIRDMLPEEHEVHQELQEIIWRIGQDIGES